MIIQEMGSQPIIAVANQDPCLGLWCNFFFLLKFNFFYFKLKFLRVFRLFWYVDVKIEF
jgi:hypothetical protein